MPGQPVFLVIAGPSGGGKSIRFSVHDSGVDAFNVDDRCRELHGSYRGIPPGLRAQAQKESEDFVDAHIRDRLSFATETTWRTSVAIDQAVRAKAVGFWTSILYLGTSDVEINLERVRLRGLAGGHSAPPDVIRENYASSLRNLPAALLTFDHGEVYDNSGDVPRRVLDVAGGAVKAIHAPLPTWVRQALGGTPLEPALDPGAS